MSKDLEVLLRTTYLGALMMMVSRNTLKYRGHTAETERGQRRHQTLGRDGTDCRKITRKKKQKRNVSSKKQKNKITEKQ